MKIIEVFYKKAAMGFTEYQLFLDTYLEMDSKHQVISLTGIIGTGAQAD